MIRTELKTNPENGRRSGDVWNIPIRSDIEISKGDNVFILADGYGVSNPDSGGIYLGVADETKTNDEETKIIVISRGVFPFNVEQQRKGQIYEVGSRFVCVNNNTLRTAKDCEEYTHTCYKHSGKDFVYAKIHTKL
jgi:hypothetical protein